MAGEIQIGIVMWPHRVTNANAIHTHVSMTNNYHMPKGWRLPTDAAVDINGTIGILVPNYVAGTPNGKVRMHWATTSGDTTSTLRLFVKARSVAPNSGSLDGSWDDELYVDDTGNGANVLNEAEVSLSSAAVSSGRRLQFVFRRDAPGVGADTFPATVYLLGAWLVADKTT